MGKCKVKDAWFQNKDQNGYTVGSWARKAGESEIQCIICDCVFKIDHGQYRITQHAGMKTHINNCKTKLTPLQLRLEKCDVNQNKNLLVSPSSSQLKMTNLKTSAVKAELIWTVKCVLSHYSLNSNNDIGEVFRMMFDSSLLQEFSLSPTKIMYLITEALGPYFRNKTIKDAENTYYSICFDETTNESSQKELQIAIRYWSNSECQIVQRHLQTFFMGRATAEELQTKILLAIKEANLPFKKMLMLSCDGPNVNKKLSRLINENILEIRNKGLIDIGSCSLHKVHNAFLKGLLEIGNDVTDLIITVFHFFDGWPARWEDYTSIQNKIKVPNHRFIKHVPSRWLSVGPAAERVLEQWKALDQYFLNFIPKNSSRQVTSSKNYKDIVKYLKQPDMRAQIILVTESSSFFTKYTRFFQQEGPLVHLLYEHGVDLLFTLKSKVYKAGLSTEENLIPLKDIFCNEILSTELKNMKETDVIHFRHKMRNHYVASSKYLEKQLNFEKVNNLLKDIRCLNMDNFKLPSSEPQIVALGNAIPFDVDTSQLLDEWKLLKFEENVTKDNGSIDRYWTHFFNIKNAANDDKFPTLTKVVKAALALSHGSASIERGFSTSGLVLTSDKTAMNERGINARLNILSGMKKYNSKVSLLPITDELLLLARKAYQSYKNYLEEEKNKEKMKTEKDKREEAEKNILAEIKQKAEEATKLKQLSRDLVEKKNRKRVRKRLLINFLMKQPID